MKPLQLTMRAFGAYAGEQIIDFTLLGDKNFFLIHGPTGSGKTTILDAISFALYGSASGDLRESKNLRSDYAPAEQKTEVEFTFKSGEYIYQVLRAPEQELKKQRGEGTRKVPAAAALFKILTDGSKEPLAAKSDEVTKKITELIGFKAEQFRQIVLLPQGEFRRFLIAESKDRKSILETIFKTELYRRIEALLAEHSTAIDNDYKALKQQQQFILNSTECENNDQLLADIQIFLQFQQRCAVLSKLRKPFVLQLLPQKHYAAPEPAAIAVLLLQAVRKQSAVQPFLPFAAAEIFVCQPNKALSRQQQRRKQSCRNCTKSFQNNYNSLTVKVSRILRTWIKRWSF